ncbi:MAG: ABC transporter substrate-binding protein [Janthinobacterium lividum]
MLTRRLVLQAGAALAASGLIPPDARAAGRDLSGITLRIGTYRGMDQIILPGTGEDHTPYTTQFSEFTGGNLITQAMNADAVDIGNWSEIPLVFAAAARSNIRVVAVLEGPTANQAVLVPKGSSARSIADLKGKRVGYVRATTAHYFLIKMLEQHGLSFDDIQPIALGISAGLTAMKSGALDAWATYGYAIPMLEADTGARVLQNAVGILSGNYLVGASPRDLEDPAFRDAMVDYIHRLGRAYRVLDADKPRWAKLVAPVVNVPEPIALAYLREEEKPFSLRSIRKSDIASAQTVAETFAQVKLLPAGLDVSGYFSDALSAQLPLS